METTENKKPLSAFMEAQMSFDKANGSSPDENSEDIQDEVNNQKIVITDINMSIASMAVFMIKLTIATIPSIAISYGIYLFALKLIG